MSNAMSEAMSLVMSGKYAQAKEAADKMFADFAGNPDVPEMLYWISGRLQQFDSFEEAKQIYEQIIRDFPESPWATKAKMCSAMTEAIWFIVSGKFAEAQAVTDKMAADFNGRPDLPEMLYWITERFERIGRADDAQRNYQRIIDLFPNKPFAKKAKLGIPRAEVRGFVEAEDFDNAEIALNKMTSDFASHPDLPETLYWLAQRYQDFGQIEDANRLCQQIIQNYANSVYAGKAQAIIGIQITEDSVPQEVMEIRDINVETEAVELYRVARGYEDVNDFDSSAKAYEQVVKDYPATIKGSNAVLDIRRLEILNAFDSNEANLADILLAQYVEDFNQNPYGGVCLELLADKCYWRGNELRIQGNPQQAKSRFAFAENVLQIIIDKKLSGNSTIGANNDYAALYYSAAGCRQQQGKWDGAITYFQKVAENYPGFQYAWNAQIAIGWCYEALRDLNQAPKEAINPLAEEAYKAVLSQYHDCIMADYAAYRLAELSVEKGDKVNAISYYNKFLELTKQEGKMIEMVKAKIASLEEETK